MTSGQKNPKIYRGDVVFHFRSFSPDIRTMTIENGSPFKILVVDDNRTNLSCIERAFNIDGYLTRTCDDGLRAIEAVKDWSPHLIVLDVNMPGKSGLDVLKEVRRQDREEYTGIILVTANSDLQDIIQGLDAGADDYIIKPFRMHELKARARSTLRVKKTHDELLQANMKLKERTTRDDLTNLRNMGYTLAEFDRLIRGAISVDAMISCIMLDMDDFKHVNDSHGHLSGSELLIKVADLMKASARETDILARFGGDEFLVVLPGTSPGAAAGIAEKLREKFEATNFDTQKNIVHITASFGVAGASGLNILKGLSAQKLIKSADDALYVAKGSGKNRVEIGVL